MVIKDILQFKDNLKNFRKVKIEFRTEDPDGGPFYWEEYTKQGKWWIKTYHYTGIVGCCPACGKHYENCCNGEYAKYSYLDVYEQVRWALKKGYYVVAY